MRTPSWLLVVVATFAAACHGDDSKSQAASTFTAFQAALLRGDAAACRDLLTRESLPAVAELQWQEVQRRKPLVVLEVVPTSWDFRVHVADPNDGNRESEIVVVREYGRFVVDLVATAGMHTRIVEATGSRQEFEQGELTPADVDRMRKYQLSQPPR